MITLKNDDCWEQINNRLTRLRIDGVELTAEDPRWQEMQAKISNCVSDIGDALRFQWLNENRGMGAGHFFVTSNGNGVGNLRAAIDAARNGTPVPELSAEERMRLAARAPKTAMEAYMLIVHLCRLIPADLLAEEVHKGEVAPEIGFVQNPAAWDLKSLGLHKMNVDVTRKVLELRRFVAKLDEALGMPEHRLELDRKSSILVR